MKRRTPRRRHLPNADSFAGAWIAWINRCRLLAKQLPDAELESLAQEFEAWAGESMGHWERMTAERLRVEQGYRYGLR